MCGEHTSCRVLSFCVTGSSPRVRGTQFSFHYSFPPFGIIPACAGNTSSVSRSGAWLRDHPRVCGEHWLLMVREHEAEGSSPRVRGTHTLDLTSLNDVGIIPACAGNTSHCIGCPSVRRDHPRVCGEHHSSIMSSAFRRGSSPRVRGTPPARTRRAVANRIIPACAGNTDLLAS